MTARIFLPLLAAFSLTFSTFTPVQAQNSESRLMAGLSAVFLDYNLLLNGEMSNLRQLDPGISMGAHAYIAPWANFSLNSAFVPESAYPLQQDRLISTSLIDVNTLFKLKANGTILREDALFAPYIATGFGMNSASNNFRMYVPVGMGLQIQASQSFSFQFEGIYKQRLAPGQFQHVSYAAGIVFALSQKKKKPEPKPVEPEETKPAIAEAKADRDGDGVADEDDICPDDKGLALYLGCPAEANPASGSPAGQTPPVVSPASPYATPGTPSQNLSRPPLPPLDEGGAMGNGSIGIVDMPENGTETGTEASSPAASSASGGTISSADRKFLSEAVDKIFFDAGSAEIRGESLKVLDQVADILRRNPDYNLQVLGHTDNTGPHKDNVILSIRRAYNVKYYLVYKKGIKIARISSDGYANAAPLSSNETEEGRRVNRRVEFRVSLASSPADMPPVYRSDE